MARVNKITGRAVKKKVPLKRIRKRGLQAPGFEDWEKLDEAYSQMVTLQDLYFYNYLR